ncbi:MAG: hypothetical protein ACP5QU_07255 [Anaerolineae bacterium]
MRCLDDLLMRLPCEPASPDLAKRICLHLRARLRPRFLPFLSEEQMRRLAWGLDAFSLLLLLALSLEVAGGESLRDFGAWLQASAAEVARWGGALLAADWSFLRDLWNGLQAWSVTALPLALSILALGIFLMVVSNLSEEFS